MYIMRYDELPSENAIQAFKELKAKSSEDIVVIPSECFLQHLKDEEAINAIVEIRDKISKWLSTKIDWSKFDGRNLDLLCNEYKIHREDIIEATVPDGVTLIEEYAFNGCEGLKSITIPKSVMGIGEYAFHLCNCDIIYDGTEEQWNKLINEFSLWDFSGKVIFKED